LLFVIPLLVVITSVAFFYFYLSGIFKNKIHTNQFFRLLVLGICWKHGSEHSGLSLFKPTNQDTFHPFSTNSLEQLDIKEGGTLRLSR